MTTHPVRIFALSAAVLALAACARTEEASLVPAEEGTYDAVEQVRTPERNEQEMAIGEWSRTIEAEQPALAFGPVGAPPLFSILCEERRGLVLQRHGTVPVGDLPMMLVQVGSEARRLAVSTAGGTVPMLRASLAPSDELVQTLANAEEPITIRIGDAAPLIMPADPAIGAFLEECRTGEAAVPAAAQEDAAPAEPAENALQPSG